MAQRVVLNLAPQHTFKGIADIPEAQLLLLVPRNIWERARAYVPHFEAVNLAGRFGADPGDFEWEVLDQPQGFKWWRRTAIGDAAYCAAIIAPNTETDPIEVFGVVDIASNSPWWYDAIEHESELQGLSETMVRQGKTDLDTARLQISIEAEYRPRQLVISEGDENGVAWRLGAAAEVKQLKDALIGLFSRARAATLPSEIEE